MNTLVLLDPERAKEEIAGHLAALPCASPGLSAVRREQIIANCMRPVCMLVEAATLAGQAGPEEEAVLMHIVHVWAAHYEADQRRRGFDGLLRKLAGCKKHC